MKKKSKPSVRRQKGSLAKGGKPKAKRKTEETQAAPAPAPQETAEKREVQQNHSRTGQFINANGKRISPVDRRARFIQLYVCYRNASRAAREAGYTDWMGQELLKVPDVKEEIDRRLAIVAKRYELKAERVIGELVKVAFGSLDSFIRIDADGNIRHDFSGSTTEERAALQELAQEEVMLGRGDDAIPIRKTKIKMYDKVRALEVLGRHLKLFDSIDPGSSPEDKAALVRRFLAAAMKADGDGGTQ